MKNDEQLLRDVIREGDYEQFQREVHGMILREARGRKRARKRRMLMAAAAAFVTVSTLVWSSREVPVLGEGTGLETVVTAVIPGDELPKSMIVRSAGNVEVVRSVDEVEVVRTLDGSVALIGDGDLLAMFGDEVVALVGSKPGEKRLVMLEGMAGSVRDGTN